MFFTLTPRSAVAGLTRRVLVVADDPIAMKSLVRTLILEGFETLVTSTLAGAFEHLAALPDVVLTDLTLPDGSGLNLVRRIRRRNQTAAVALLTAAADSDFADADAHYRPDAVFQKPLVGGELMSWVTRQYVH